MALVVDEFLARMSPCVCYKYDGKDICWSAGCIGTLTDEQEKKYCREKIYKGRVSERVKKRWKKFAEVVDYCEKWFEHGYDNYWECMSKETKKAGLS